MYKQSMPFEISTEYYEFKLNYNISVIKLIAC